jgi:hypothetical protein
MLILPLAVLELIRKLRKECSAGLQTGCTGGVHAARSRLRVWRPTVDLEVGATNLRIGS